MNWFLALTIALAIPQTLDGPRISISKSPSHTIIVEGVPANSIGACVIFQSEDELLAGKPWAPRHCAFWFAGDMGASFQDDWDFITTGHNYEIWAEIQTVLPDGSEGPDFTTNHIHEAH